MQESERLLYQIRCLEADNEDLNKKLNEFNDKEYHSYGV